MTSVEEDFDPLSLFTAPPATEPAEEVVVETRDTDDIPGPFVDDMDDPNQPLHFLDLPLLQLNPPNEVVLLILKLLAPEQVFNFSPNTSKKDNDDSESVDSALIFTAKDVTGLVPIALPWLSAHCPRFNTEIKLAHLPSLSHSLKTNFESAYNAWLTKIISTDKYSDEAVKQASLRVSENCGRTAQPEIVRKITIPGLETFGRPYISLKEPSLTSDNLGLKTWGSSLILSSRLIRNSTTTNSTLIEPILELGSGTGLVGLVSSIVGHTTLLTDLKEIISNLQTNVELNKIGSRATVEELDWSNPQDFIQKCHISKGKPIDYYNTILISDPIYLSQHPYWVVEMISLFLSKTNAMATVMIQIPLRPKYEQERKLLWDLLKQDFEVIDEEIEDGFDDFGEMRFCFKQLKRRL